MLKEIRTRIVGLANAMKDGWLELKLPYDKKYRAKKCVIRVARIPFERWMAGTSSHRESEWENQSPHGLKMQMDDRNHSDWWLSSGVPIEFCHIDDYDYEFKRYWKENPYYVLALRLNKAAWHYKFEHMNHGGWMYLIKPRKKIEGRVSHIRTKKDILDFVEHVQYARKPDVTSSWKDVIAVVPRASPEFDLVVRSAAAIITCEGNKVAHLVKVAREENIPVILHPKAFDEFWNWEQIVIDGERIWRNR